jgi:citrate lyase subunit beta/citryl-CoA lyase
MERLRRSMLFVPGNSPNMIQNAGFLGADSIILDLEDAVSIDEKDSARCLIGYALRYVDFNDCEVVVRVNSPSSPFGIEDIKEISKAKPDAIMIPMATEEDIKIICNMITEIEKEKDFEIGSIKLIPIAETAYSIENISTILKSSKRITAVLLGAEDLTADLEVARTKEGDEIFYARTKIAYACKAHKVDAIDTPFSDINDEEGLIKDTEIGKGLGMTGKAVINPRQIDIINKIFLPTLEEIEYAKDLLEAAEKAKNEGKGVFSFKGKMVDAPIIHRAETILKKAKLGGLI